jgi:hypothetical protein
LTQFSTKELGEQLHRIVSAPGNQRLTIDFPALQDVYGSAKAAYSAVKSRQADMRREPDYAALAVMIGVNKQAARVYGATSMLTSTVPGSGEPGVNMAIWLDANRPKAFRGVGRELLRMRIHWLFPRPDFSGKIWTIIRPGNHASMNVWRQTGYPMTLQPVDKPKPYAEVDGVSTPRQLFVSAQSLEQARR